MSVAVEGICSGVKWNRLPIGGVEFDTLALADAGDILDNFNGSANSRIIYSEPLAITAPTGIEPLDFGNVLANAIHSMTYLREIATVDLGLAVRSEDSLELAQRAIRRIDTVALLCQTEADLSAEERGRKEKLLDEVLKLNIPAACIAAASEAGPVMTNYDIYEAPDSAPLLTEVVAA